MRYYRAVWVRWLIAPVFLLTFAACTHDRTACANVSVVNRWACLATANGAWQRQMDTPYKQPWGNGNDPQAQREMANTASPSNARTSNAPPTPPKELVQRAEGNDPEAQYKFAYYLYDVSMRQYWLCRSASQSHEHQDEAMFWLAAISEYDLHDGATAYRWYTLADQHGHTGASAALERVGKTLTFEQMQSAKEAAANWKPGDCGQKPQVIAS